MREKWELLPKNNFMNCQEFNEIADSYLADELLVETNHEVLRHLENCANCRQYLSAQRDLRERLKSAVINSPEMNLNAGFRAKLHNELYESLFPQTIWQRFKNGFSINYKFTALAAACLLLISLSGIFLLKRESISAPVIAENNPTDINILPPDSSVIAAMQRETVEKAVGDHKNCAVKFNLAELPISLDKAVIYGKFNQKLDRAVIAAIKDRNAGKSADKIEFVEAHSCVFGGKRFAHLVIRYRNSVVSILVSQPDFPEQTEAKISTQTAENMRLADFHAGQHEVLIVSDLSERDNLQIARIFQPIISRRIKENEI